MNFLFASLLLAAGGISLRTPKRILMVIAPVNFRDEELLVPKRIFEENKTQVTIASKLKGLATGKLGAKINVDLDIANISADDWDALVFVGGGGAQVFWDDPAVHALILDAYGQHKVIAAICIAPVILANAGLLKGKRATVFPDEASRLSGKGAQYCLENVVSDSKIITADGPAASRDFALKILEELQK